MEYTNKDFDEISQRMNQLLEKMGDFWMRVEQHIANHV
jgi:tetrahydromethanopterin S-methyltransferase subunit G